MECFLFVALKKTEVSSLDSLQTRHIHQGQIFSETLRRRLRILLAVRLAALTTALPETRNINGQNTRSFRNFRSLKLSVSLNKRTPTTVSSIPSHNNAFSFRFTTRAF